MTATTPDLLTLPKAELHLHIEGTLEPEFAFTLAARNGVALPFASVAELAEHYRFDNLQSFLDLYYATMNVLRTEDDFAELTLAYLTRAAAQGVRHAEIFFDPQAHTQRGVPIEAVIDGIAAGFADAARGPDPAAGAANVGSANAGSANDPAAELTGGLILSFLRDRPVEEADATLTSALGRTALTGRDLLLGVGLDSAEVGHPPHPFAPVYDRARAEGLHTVAHAGEEGPPSYVWEALDVLRVERVDHGIRSIDDPQLVARLAHDRTPLTICPLSNVRLHAVPSLAEHPLLRLAEAGVVVTLNSDDPAYFGGYVGDNFTASQNALGFDTAQAVQFARNSIEACFAPLQRKAQLSAEIDRWVAARAAGGV
ncbi:adenosine deaminase family protein [Rathayibacter soli]|uniref:adenosine deaminase family protein n=1 Tax=Rathayibacter soli TaxID=3144168 RepID=UPI0027E484D3|nr:adenosine deaminase family protein [Glaciibacter superstes]